jgi:hypothetical protein
MERLVQLIKGDEPAINPMEEEEFEAASSGVGEEPQKGSLAEDDDDEDSKIEEI